MEFKITPQKHLDILPVYQPGRPIEEVARELGLSAESIIKLASNENPLGPSPLALEAMTKALQNCHLYPDGNVFYLKDKLAKKLGVASENLSFGNGSNEVLELIGHAFLGQGIDVVVSQYCFAVYPIVTRLFGANLICVPALDYGHDLRAMLKAITPATKIVFIANPNNPTGVLAPRESVLEFLAKVPQEVLVVMDEAYTEFQEDPLDLIPFVRDVKYPNLVVVRTFSKIYGLAGLRIGYAIGHPELIKILDKVREPFNVCSIAQAGALAAIDDEQHICRTRSNNIRGMQFLEKSFSELALTYVPSSANFILVKVGDGQKVFVELQKLGVIARPVGGYQLPEWIRVTIGTEQENRRFVEALSKVLGK